MSAESILFVSFKFINFFIVIYLIYYAFNKYLYKSLKASVNKEQSDLESLLNEIDSTKEKIDNLNQSYLNQIKELELLESKLSSWSKNCAEARNLNEAINKNIEQQLNEKRSIQEANFNKIIEEKEIIKKVIEKSEIDLKNKFEDKSSSLNYLDKLISFMQKD